MDRASSYEHDIPSLSASLEAFDPERSMHSAHSGHSTMYSSRWSVPQDDADSETESDGPWAPPAWQKSQSSNHWYRKSLLGESALRSSRSPFEYRTDREVTPSRIPLPESPYKMTPRTSPEPIPEEEQRYMADSIASRLHTVQNAHSLSEDEPPMSASTVHAHESALAPQNQNEACPAEGFMRFAYRGEAKFRTAPIEDTISSFATGLNRFTGSRANLLLTIATIVFSWILLQPWTATLIPDVANVANMAKQFEPLLYASENVIPRSRELAEASIAVQDLGESVRATNMSASSVIIDQLDDLGDHLKVLAEKLTSFFTNVDGDMDSILITMEWAKRELQSIQGPKIGIIDTVIGNVHGGLSKVGLLERNGSPTAVGRVVNDVLGHTTQQRSKATLQRTFDYLLSTLEENIANELARADVLFQLFESVDRQFHNLHRSVAKEEDSLANKKDEFLASMWRQTINNKMKIKKYEKNLKLLKDVRASTLINKSELKTHIQVIQSVKDQLDKARKNLISPLIRRAQSNSFGLEQQLSDLTGTYGFLKNLRDGQKKKVLQQLWGEPKRRIAITAGGREEEIDDSEQ
ncbi:hypothetical protein PTNB73_04641 [Pyrenophora teres f. teres]|uniref:Uncharacterized protein n=2 Tax=Pyrenophora teres f. teres TaxID=97479 RepID=E3RZD9_PYRTT|nr:hypothetical protein PTT_14998 [Pyrenophora teres f. teres 0-1]KAE8836685.1 hypothetical protein HRS9139_04783 [Pyrenophora teres f. teres]CAA9956461.1 hypothetical protein PTMSG1_00069 [Pyrenophora teres f. maculata]KAE8837343.1 hypothetical protein PTNB85_04678 [Pyrenophora teres f. teres]KAE8840235.1 hypothetical protein HRS9122_06840 [Pyrenophora teres f. teres]